MRHTLFPALSLATLLLACAHDRAHQNTSEANAEARASANAENARDRDHDRVADRDHDRAADNDPDRARDRDAPGENRRADRVDLPQKRGEPGRLASADDAVPPAAGQAPDNSGVNERDRDDKNLTAGDQGNGEVDIDLTQRIRKAVMSDDSLSFTAKNAKIITRDGHVTLRGPVKSAVEKEVIYKCAVSAAGVGHVTNQLEVKGD